MLLVAVARVIICVTGEVFDKETDPDEINTAARTLTPDKQDLRKAENRNLLNTVCTDFFLTPLQTVVCIP